MSYIRLLESTGNSVVIGVRAGLDDEYFDDTKASLEEALVKKIRQEHPSGQLVFDFSDVDYIAPAGLRCLIKSVQKESEKVKIINVKDDVYRLFETSGILKLFDVHRKTAELSSKDLTFLAKGGNGAVYRIDPEYIVKVFQKTAPLEAVEREKAMAQQALIIGVPTAISYSIVKVDGCYGIVFELINSDVLSHVLRSRPEDYDHFVEEYISLYKKIHAIEDSAQEFPSIKQIYYDAIEECRDYYTQEELGKLSALVESVPESDHLIHGDFSPNNIMVQNDELILIDMGDMSRGHIVFDFLATAATQKNLVDLNPEFAEIFCQMPLEMIKGTWRRLIDTYFADKTQEQRARIEKQICLMTKLKVGLAPAFGRGAPPEIIKGSVADARANLLPHIDELIGAIDW